ncbi:MAG: hypothetical protein HY960_10435 [Ignavibacteriae bacterium]|nr:hypothetical protein [Ignavibacteriota bacterium]
MSDVLSLIELVQIYVEQNLKANYNVTTAQEAKNLTGANLCRTKFESKLQLPHLFEY